MLRAYRYRLYPNKKQRELTHKTIGCCRFVYNYYLNKRIEIYQNEGKTLNYNACANDLPNLKQQYQWLREVDSIALQQALKDLDNAYNNFLIMAMVFLNSRVKRTRNNLIEHRMLTIT